MKKLLAVLLCAIVFMGYALEESSMQHEEIVQTEHVQFLCDCFQKYDFNAVYNFFLQGNRLSKEERSTCLYALWNLKHQRSADLAMHSLELKKTKKRLIKHDLLRDIVPCLMSMGVFIYSAFLLAQEESVKRISPSSSKKSMSIGEIVGVAGITVSVALLSMLCNQILDRELAFNDAILQEEEKKASLALAVNSLDQMYAMVRNMTTLL